MRASTAPAGVRVRDTRLRGFLLGAFGISWVLWIPAGLDLRGSIDLPLPATLLVVLGSFGPMLAAIAVTARHGGWAAVKALLGRLRFRGVAGRWFVLALVLGSVTVVPALVHLFTGGSTDTDAVAAHLAAVPLHFLVVATVGGGLDEELGWRGVAQPQLQLRMSPVPANLLLGLVWAAWHLPLWLDPDSAQAAYPFAVYAVVIVGHSLMTGYLYNASGGSLLIAVLVHSTNNTGDGIRYAVLGQSGDDLSWQLLLAAASLALGAAFSVYTRGRLGMPAAPVDVPYPRARSVDGVDADLTARDVLSRRPRSRP